MDPSQLLSFPVRTSEIAKRRLSNPARLVCVAAPTAFPAEDNRGGKVNTLHLVDLTFPVSHLTN